MRSTGEVLGMGDTFGEAFYKAQEATKNVLPLEGTVLISVNDKDKPEVLQVAKDFVDSGLKVVATGRTFELIRDAGLPVEKINKMQEGRPNILDAISNGEIQLIINTPAAPERKFDDSYIRRGNQRKDSIYDNHCGSKSDGKRNKSCKGTRKNSGKIPSGSA